MTGSNAEPQTSLADIAEVIRTLTLFQNREAPATEISAFRVELDDFMKGVSGKSLKTVAGYWTVLDSAAKTIETFLRWTQKSRSPEAFYFLLNPANPALAARSYNEWDLRAERRTGDADIIVLRYLLIDLDACRPAGISSTEEEHAIALAGCRRKHCE
jgi:hypothetical protein